MRSGEEVIDEIAQHAISIYEPRCAAAGINVSTSFRSSRSTLLRRGEMMQVISTLIANSIYAMPTGGHLSVIVEDTDEPVSGIDVIIMDDGVGIAPHDLPQVFEAFFTVRTTVGTGIGLFVAKQCIEGHEDKSASRVKTIRKIMEQQSGYLYLYEHHTMPHPKCEAGIIDHLLGKRCNDQGR